MTQINFRIEEDIKENAEKSIKKIWDLRCLRQ